MFSHMYWWWHPESLGLISPSPWEEIGEKLTTDSGFLNNQTDFINIHSPNESTSAFPASLNLPGRSLGSSFTKQSFLFLGFLKNHILEDVLPYVLMISWNFGPDCSIRLGGVRGEGFYKSTECLLGGAGGEANNRFRFLEQSDWFYKLSFPQWINFSLSS